jgi:DNA-binding NtrC family response regulator
MQIMNNDVKIFILDDDRYFGNFILHALKDYYNDVTYFQTESECIRALHDKPNILILDHKLKHCTGLEMLGEVQRICGASTSVLYLSAQEHVHVTIKAMRLGALEYLEKGSNTIHAITNSINKIQQLTNHFSVVLNINEYRAIR